MAEIPARVVPENNLFDRARAGEAAAWDELFNACYPKVKRAIRAKLQSQGRMRAVFDASDFASDVMKSLAAKRDRFDFPDMAQLVAFLTQCVEQKFIDEHRRQHARKRDVQRQCSIDDLDLHAGEAMAAGDPTPSQVAQADETLERILRLHDDPAEQEVIRLKMAEYSTSEITERTRKSQRSIQRMLKKTFETTSSWWGLPRSDT